MSSKRSGRKASDGRKSWRCLGLGEKESQRKEGISTNTWGKVSPGEKRGKNIELGALGGVEKNGSSAKRRRQTAEENAKGRVRKKEKSQDWERRMALRRENSLGEGSRTGSGGAEGSCACLRRPPCPVGHEKVKNAVSRRKDGNEETSVNPSKGSSSRRGGLGKKSHLKKGNGSS